ncbi:MAG: hypothetical protein PHS06_05330, partial [Candidatus Shapirobacteria bacterium]|nr:hypothetical protein [Candidatus Shapirobacteria bacterium]
FNDYINTIYLLKDTKDFLYTELDYQYFFEPTLEDLRDCGLKNILNKSKDFLINEYYKWLIVYDKKE